MNSPVVGSAPVAQRRAPAAGEITDGLLLEADDDEGTGQGLGQPGALQNVKRWMKQLHFPDQVRPGLLLRFGLIWFVLSPYVRLLVIELGTYVSSLRRLRMCIDEGKRG